MVGWAQMGPTAIMQPIPSLTFSAAIGVLPKALEVTQVAGREVPTRWRLQLPDRGLDVEVAAVNPNAWMDLLYEYWEGPVRVSGSHEGIGYLEMTGYE